MFLYEYLMDSSAVHVPCITCFRRRGLRGVLQQEAHVLLYAALQKGYLKLHTLAATLCRCTADKQDAYVLLCSSGRHT